MWKFVSRALNLCVVVHAFTLPSIPSDAKRKGLFHAWNGKNDVEQVLDNTKTVSAVSVGDAIGSGSYGTVHKLQLESLSSNQTYVGKRPWLAWELKTENPKERAMRCKYYWEVEEHCFSKLPSHPQLPPYLGVHDEWMVFGLVGSHDIPAPTLKDLMKEDLDEPQELRHIGKALGCQTYEETLDRVLESLLTVLEHIHQHQIVHRDIKPSNLLVHDGSLLLMDFGSAADLEPAGLLQKRKGLENGNRVAISPIYCAPEVFIDVHEAPTSFDMFSAGLLFSQLLFSYLDERTDAGFHQQLNDTNWDLSVWLSNELGSKLRPDGLEHSLEYLADRPGLWTLLEDMLSEQRTKRPTASEALKQLQSIRTGSGGEDGPFFRMVLESMETCPMPTISQPLHYVATFSRTKPLGLVLSEADDEDPNPQWKEGTKFAQPGEVFIREIVSGGQAEQLGDFFDIGDQLQGIGDLPFVGGGFEKAVEMLQDQPRNAKNVKLHFDRLSVRSNEAIPMVPPEARQIQLVDMGAWSSKGRRNAQEDTFILHEIHDIKENSVLVAGVMDGHGGSAASALVATEMPDLLSKELVVNRKSLPDALQLAWETVCATYEKQCTNLEECRADYNPWEGILMANTGGADLVPGTTITMLALDETTGRLSALNCGDSRSLVISATGKVVFATHDHTPQSEEERLKEGIDVGLDYSLPKCTLSKWSLSVGAYEYSVARSLEGPFATSKGIVSEPDITSEISVNVGEALLLASDGLWEVMDSNEVALGLQKLRQDGLSASDAAKTLCSMALRKGTSDNVSVVVVYL